MKLSKSGIEQLQQREGLRLKAYYDSAGILTIGYGHTAHWIRQNSEIDKKEADHLFNSDVAWAERAVTNKARVGLTQEQFDSLVSFVFNIGETAFYSSTLLRELNKGNYWSVPGQMMRWNKVTVGGRKRVERGLINRRTSEVAQWNSLYAECESCSVTPDQPEGRKPMALLAQSKTAQAGTTVAAASGYSLVTDLLSKAQELKTNLIDVLPDTNMVFVAMACVGVFIVYNRISDSRKGRAY